MTSYFVCGSIGASLGGKAWEAFGWSGVVGVGLLFVIALLMVHLLSNKRSIDK